MSRLVSQEGGNVSDEVWYVSYGSNMSATRMAVYLEGGIPPGGTRMNPGARDPRPSRGSVPVDLPGALYFAGESTQWGGGVAFYDHEATGPTAARAYLVTVEQFADIAAQEMHRAPANGDPLEQVVSTGLVDGRHHLGPGCYETVIEVGRLDGVPMLTFTAPHGIDQVPHTRPAAAYLRLLGDGLRESRGWDEDEIATYFLPITD